MSFSDPLAPYIYILVLIALAFVLFLCYRLWQFIQDWLYRRAHRPSKTMDYKSEMPARIVPTRRRDPGRRWTVDPDSSRGDASTDRGASERSEVSPTSGELSEREKEVARLALEGKSNKQIAQELSISVGTVENHMTNIFRKLHIGSRKELKYVPRYWLE